jgi:hypothetical protein
MGWEYTREGGKEGGNHGERGEEAVRESRVVASVVAKSRPYNQNLIRMATPRGGGQK